VLVHIDGAQRPKRQKVERVALLRNDARFEPATTSDPVELDVRHPLA